MESRQLLDERQPDARAFVRAGARVLDAMEALEHAGKISLGNADAGIGDAQLDAIAPRSQVHLDPAFEGELEGVRQQIQDDLFPHVPIHVHGFRQRIAADDERETCLFNGRSEHAREVGRHLREVRGFVGGVDAPGLDAREIQERIDQPQQPEGVAMRHLLPLPMHGRQRRHGIGQAVFERSHQQGERGSQFVADVAEERRLRPIELGQRFGALPRLLVRARVGQSASQLIGDQVQEPLVVVVERAPRIEADDQPAGSRVRAR